MPKQSSELGSEPVQFVLWLQTNFGLNLSFQAFLIYALAQDKFWGQLAIEPAEL